MDRNVHAHFYRQPISIDCQVLFIFFFSGRLCRNRYCTFLDFQNRFDKVCRIVFRFVRRSAVRSPASCEIGNGTYSWKFAPAISPVSLHAPKDGIRLPQSVTYLPYPFPHRMAFLLSLGKGSAREIPFFSLKNNKEEQAGVSVSAILSCRPFFILIFLPCIKMNHYGFSRKSIWKNLETFP